jgi:hypothetical protein
VRRMGRSLAASSGQRAEQAEGKVHRKVVRVSSQVRRI